MAERSPTLADVPRTYAELRRAVERTIIRGQQAADLARVRTYHETGRLIHEHVLLFKERADYGAKTIPKLAADVKVHRSVLLRCVQFFRAFPIVATWRQLSWAHFRELLPLADTRQQRALATEANRQGWPVARLVARIRELAPAGAVEPAPATRGETPARLEPARGTPGLHRIVEKTVGRSVDLGFRHYWPLKAEQAERFAAGDIVQIARDESLRAAAGATKDELFTYAAQLVRVVDGDTLAVALELSPGVFLEQKLRLRGLDCPEIGTPEGKAAKRFVDGLVANATALVIHTTKPDKYDRYLADVFLAQAGGEVFLNNALLENGHAVRKDAADFGDWQPDLL
ncbi:MAG: thermonuclease family protein [Verrucomicrobia bacterium]|nr:thermonuclease family protein [Verrucomicrobiota bacterium]